ncbi:MAG: hypothetical protein WBN97_03985, partial [Parvibaculum sp.]
LALLFHLLLALGITLLALLFHLLLAFSLARSAFGFARALVVLGLIGLRLTVWLLIALVVATPPACGKGRRCFQRNYTDTEQGCQPDPQGF